MAKSNRTADIDLDPGIVSIARYSEKDEESTGEGHPEDETTNAGVTWTLVDPNPKCNQCSHYDTNRGACTVSLYPSSCGDGAKPETGFSPMTPSPLHAAAKQVKDGLAFNAPRGSVSIGPDGSGVSGAATDGKRLAEPIESVLGDEAHIGKSVIAKDMGGGTKLHSTVEGFMTGLKNLPKEGAHRGKYVTAHMAHKPFHEALAKHPKGSVFRQHLNSFLNSKANAGPKVPTVTTAKSASRIASQAWKSVDVKNRAKYIKHAMARHKKDGENVSSLKYANRAPREFKQRIMGKSTTFVSEFGPDLAAVLMKARNEIRDELRKASPFMQESRRQQMSNRDNTSKRLARKANHGNTFSMRKLAMSMNVKDSELADLAHSCNHVEDFVKKCRSTYKKQSKQLTDNHFRSAYHSTGLRHSIKDNDMGNTSKAMTAVTEADLVIIKSHRDDSDCVIGHTSTGKAVTTKGTGAAKFTAEEHDEAAEMHRDVASRISDAAYGYGPNNYSSGRKLPPAAFKYLQKIATEHRTLAERHNKTRSENMDKARKKNDAIAAANGLNTYSYKEPESFKSMNPTDAEVANAILLGGVTEGGMRNAPVNARPQSYDRLERSLPDSGDRISAPSEAVEEERPLVMTGGVPGSALDIGNFRK